MFFYLNHYIPISRDAINRVRSTGTNIRYIRHISHISFIVSQKEPYHALSILTRKVTTSYLQINLP